MHDEELGTRISRMKYLRLHGLKCLLYAVGVLVLAPVVAEFVLRVRAFRSTTSANQTAPQPIVLPSPVMHHQLAPLQVVTLRAADDTNSIEFRTNSLGLCGNEIIVPKPEGTFRIVCLGDETVLAANVPATESFAQQIVARLQPFTRSKLEVINAAVPGFSPVLEALQVRHQLQALQADLIVAHFDISDPTEDRRYLRLTDLAADESPLACVHPQLASTPKIKSACEHFLCVKLVKAELDDWFAEHSKSDVDESQLGPRQWIQDPAFSRPDQLKAALLPFDQLAASVERSGTRLMVVVHPWVDHLTAPRKSVDAETDTVGDALDRVFADFEQSTGIVFCHMQPYFDRLPDPDAALLPDRRQLNAKGHETYGYAIAATILHRIPGPFTRSRSSTPSDGVSEAQHATSSADDSGVIHATRDGRGDQQRRSRQE